MNPNAKEFKLKDPVLTLQPQSPGGAIPYAAPKQLSPQPGPSVIQPARFNPTSAKEKVNTIPAMPNRFLAALQARAQQAEEDDEPVPIDDEPSIIDNHVLG